MTNETPRRRRARAGCRLCLCLLAATPGLFGAGAAGAAAREPVVVPATSGASAPVSPYTLANKRRHEAQRAAKAASGANGLASVPPSMRHGQMGLVRGGPNGSAGS